MNRSIDKQKDFWWIIGIVTIAVLTSQFAHQAVLKLDQTIHQVVLGENQLKKNNNLNQLTRELATWFGFAEPFGTFLSDKERLPGVSDAEYQKMLEVQQLHDLGLPFGSFLHGF